MKVSIITVSWNSNQTIKDTIESVIAQTYDDIEYIVVDGGSTDGTIETVKSYGNQIAQFVSEPDNGIYDAMNKGVGLATGDIVGILNSDDHFCDKNIVKQVVDKFLSSRAGVVLTNVCMMSNEGKVFRNYEAYDLNKRVMRFGFAPPHPGAFIAKEVYTRVGLYDTSFKISADFDFFLRILLMSEKIELLNIKSVNMLEGGVSTSGIKSYYESTKELYCALKKNRVYTNYFLILLRLPLKFLVQRA